MKIEWTTKQAHYFAHDLMIWVVNLSDRMSISEMSHFTGCSEGDVECMVDAYESMGRDYVWINGLNGSQQWAAICIRRFWVRKYWAQYSDNALCRMIVKFYSMFSHAPHRLSTASRWSTVFDRQELNKCNKYRTDWDRSAALA